MAHLEYSSEAFLPHIADSIGMRTCDLPLVLERAQAAIDRTLRSTVCRQQLVAIL